MLAELVADNLSMFLIFLVIGLIVIMTVNILILEYKTKLCAHYQIIVKVIVLMLKMIFKIWG